MTNNIVYYGFHLSTGSFGVDIYLGFLISGIIEIAACCLSIVSVQYLGRRLTIILCFGLAGFASLVIMPMRKYKCKYRQLRARRALLQFKDVPLRTRRALLLYKVYGDSALLVLNGTSLICNNALLALI